PDPPRTYTLSLHDALPIYRKWTAALRWAHYGPKKRSDLPDQTTPGDDPELANVTSSYNLVNLYLAYQPNENVIAALSVENLLDRSEEHTSELQSRENLVCR